MKKLFLLFLLSCVMSCEPVLTFAQTCEPAQNIYVKENPLQGLIGIGWTNSVGDKAQSVFINGVAYKDGNSSYSVWTGLSFINTECVVWQSLSVVPFTVGQTVTVTIREYCTYPVSENYIDTNFSYTFKNNMCTNKRKKSHKN